MLGKEKSRHRDRQMWHHIWDYCNAYLEHFETLEVAHLYSKYLGATWDRNHYSRNPRKFAHIIDIRTAPPYIEHLAYLSAECLYPNLPHSSSWMSECYCLRLIHHLSDNLWNKITNLQPKFPRKVPACYHEPGFTTNVIAYSAKIMVLTGSGHCWKKIQAIHECWSTSLVAGLHSFCKTSLRGGGWRGEPLQKIPQRPSDQNCRVHSSLAFGWVACLCPGISKAMPCYPAPWTVLCGIWIHWCLCSLS